MLGSNDELLVRQGAVTLFRLGGDVIGDLDATLLAVHPLPVVRKLAAVVAATAPVRYAHVLQALAADPDKSVRYLLAHRLHTQTKKAGEAPDAKAPRSNDDSDSAAGRVITEVLGILAKDVRHAIRQAAAGLSSWRI